MKSFGSWTTQELRNTFGLNSVERLLALTEWLKADEVPTEAEKQELSTLRAELDSLYEAWNEDELKMNFIAPLIRMVGYGKKNTYNKFYQRSISAKINNIEINGVVDMLVANGWESPTKPYFFLHEYKQEEKKGDARAQLLAAMLAAQILNADEKPIYGVYLIGASWRFVVLVGKEYTLKRFDATEEEDLLKIYQMLRWIKNYVEKESSVNQV